MTSKKTWLIADYNQAEIRVAAWAGPIPKMQQWFMQGEDIHLNVARLIGKAVEEYKIKMPNNLWMRKPYNELTNEDPERDIAKRTVHANTNGMYRNRFALITGLPVRIAGVIQDIYHGLFPEIRGEYHKWIREELETKGSLTNPFGWSRTFYNVHPITRRYDEDELRVAYAWYPQSTIGLLTIRTLKKVCEVFKTYKDVKVFTPSAIRSMGYDVQLQVHDMLGIVLPDDDDTVRAAALEIRKIAEHPLTIKGQTLIVPMDFKRGPSWGEARKYVI